MTCGRAGRDMIHTDIILGVNNNVLLQHMLLFQDVLAQ